MGNCNAHVSKEDNIKQVAGTYILHEKTYSNNERYNLVGSTNLIISSTMLEHPKYHKRTWISPDQELTSY